MENMEHKGLNAQVGARVTPEEKTTLYHLATQQGQSPSQFIRALLVEGLLKRAVSEVTHETTEAV